MVNAIIYVKGGGCGQDSKDVDIRCREGFRKLLERCKFAKRMPRLAACGGRDAVFNHFKSAHDKNTSAAYLAMWIDSEEPMEDIEKAWKHLQNAKTVSKWSQPHASCDDQVLFMTTCMETLIVSDRDSLKAHYGDNLQESALPTAVNLEQLGRHDVQDKLQNATRNCKNAYAKRKRSYEILAKLNPETLKKHLPSFARTIRILGDRL